MTANGFISQKPIEAGRQANFEMLRILSMAMVVVLHFLDHGNVLDNSSFGTLEYAVFWLIRAAAYPGVNCFVMLTGYFMVSSKAKPSKLASFVIQVLFYSISCFVVAILLNGDVNFVILRSSFLPLISRTYWFATTYALLYMIIPLLNRLILSMTKGQHLLWLVGLLAVYSVIPTFAWWSRDYLGKGNDLIWFIILYMMAAYIRLHGLKLSKAKSLTGYLCSTVVLLLSNLLIAALTFHFTGQVTSASVFYLNNTPFVFVSAVCIFMFFKEIKINSKILEKVISSVAPFTFGVYLLHENPLLREKLWTFVNASRFMGDAWNILLTILYMCGVLVVFFIVGCSMDYIYKVLYRFIKPYEKNVDAAVSKIKGKLDDSRIL